MEEMGSDQGDESGFFFDLWRGRRRSRMQLIKKVRKKMSDLEEC